ncbi:hypothetical protein DMB95_03795 [Campylobacter sp. MIT 12-8780]|uniref:MFS transporter n=1 Tax=unclassified Campylobacter TaxID=2593542 RepID=UPI00115CDCE2|nr:MULTISPECIES: MFS transporter [unclassified Campylobacter]NDJ27218.1 MFS transporter [Campylobacter sp. MIT 19-121]TQR41488.1 hypothetical protein DMB95_03795 [Campylobacter sp. MIT 12-8780]
MSLKRKYKLFNRDFMCIFWINFFIYTMFYMSTITCSDYSLLILKENASMAGLVTCVFVIGALFSRIYYGSIVDSINFKKALLIFLPLLFCINIAYLFAHSILALVLIRFVSGVFFGLCSCVCGAAVARLIPSNKRGAGIGYYALSAILASALGPFLAIKLDSAGAFLTSFILCLVCIVLCFILALIFQVRAKKFEFKAVQGSKIHIYNYIEKSCLSLAVVVFLIGCAYGLILAFMSVYSKTLNLSFAGSFFFGIYAFVALFSRPIAGKIFDKLGADFIIVPSLLFFIACLIILAYAQNSAMIFLSAVLCALGYGNACSACQSLAIKLAPKHKMGLATSTYFIALDLGIGTSPYFLGILEPFVGFSRLYEIAAALSFVALIVYFYSSCLKKKALKKG